MVWVLVWFTMSLLEWFECWSDSRCPFWNGLKVGLIHDVPSGTVWVLVWFTMSLLERFECWSDLRCPFSSGLSVGIIDDVSSGTVWKLVWLTMSLLDWFECWSDSRCSFSSFRGRSWRALGPWPVVCYACCVAVQGSLSFESTEGLRGTTERGVGYTNKFQCWNQAALTFTRQYQYSGMTSTSIMYHRNKLTLVSKFEGNKGMFERFGWSWLSCVHPKAVFRCLRRYLSIPNICLSCTDWFVSHNLTLKHSQHTFSIVWKMSETSPLAPPPQKKKAAATLVLILLQTKIDTKADRTLNGTRHGDLFFSHDFTQPFVSFSSSFVSFRVVIKLFWLHFW